jgi:hypothetical protein
MRQAYGTKVTRLTLGSLPTCPLSRGVLPALQGGGMGRQMTAEAVVAEPIGEGLNMIAGRSPVFR